MDNTNKIALTLGFGALGTVLAYYGYNQLNDDDETEENKEINEIIQNDQISKSQDKIVEKKEQSEQLETISNEIKNEIKQKVETEKITKDPQWSRYWENQYSEKDKNENIAVL